MQLTATTTPLPLRLISAIRRTERCGSISSHASRVAVEVADQTFAEYKKRRQ